MSYAKCLPYVNLTIQNNSIHDLKVTFFDQRCSCYGSNEPDQLTSNLDPKNGIIKSNDSAKGTVYFDTNCDPSSAVQYKFGFTDEDIAKGLPSGDLMSILSMAEIGGYHTVYNYGQLNSIPVNGVSYLRGETGSSKDDGCTGSTSSTSVCNYTSTIYDLPVKE